MIAYFPDDDLRLVILTNRGFVWLTELMPALIGEEPPGRGAASGVPLAGPAEYIAEAYPATLRIRLPPDGSRDMFEVDWGEVRSYARRVRE